MGNPFENLGSDTADQDWELVEESRLGCQKCGKIITTGRYYEESELLTWQCPCGHKSSMNVRL